MDLLPVDLDEFVSLKSLDINIYDTDICLWAADNKRQFPNIKINTPAYCKHSDDKENIVNGYSPTSGAQEPTSKPLTKHGNTEDGLSITYIQIQSRDLIFLFIISAFIALCGILRPCIR